MQLPSRAEILILCAAVIHRFSLSLFRMMVTALKLTTVRSSIQWNFPFFFSFGITFWSAAWQCVITILFRMPSENLVDLFTYKNYVVYFSEFLGDTKASTILHIPTIFQVERLNNTFFNSSSRNLTFRVPTWVILLYQFLNRGTLQFAYICAVSFSVTNLNLRQQEKHLYS